MKISFCRFAPALFLSSEETYLVRGTVPSGDVSVHECKVSAVAALEYMYMTTSGAHKKKGVGAG